MPEVQAAVAPVEFRSVSAPPPPDVEREQVAALPPRERTAAVLKAGMEYIREKDEQGAFAEGEQKAAAEWAQLFEGEKGVNRDNSRALEGMLTALDVVGDDTALGIRSHLTEFLRVQVADQALTYDEWNAKLASATPEERVRLEEEGLYGFVFPQEQPEQNVQQTAPEQSPEDLVITTQIATLEARIKLGQEKKTNTKAEERLLVTLRLAEKANGSLGVLLKTKAIRDLQAAGVRGLEATVEQIAPKEQAAQQAFAAELVRLGVDSTTVERIVNRVGLEQFIQSEGFSKLSGLEESIFGRKLAEGELDALVDATLTAEQKSLLQKYGKKVGLALLILFLVGPMLAIKEATRAK